MARVAERLARVVDGRVLTWSPKEVVVQAARLRLPLTTLQAGRLHYAKESSARSDQPFGDGASA